MATRRSWPPEPSSARSAANRPDFRLAAWEDNTWHVYDVPDADTGEDMLDLRNRVTAVHLVEGDRGEGILRTVDDEDRVTAIVQAVLAGSRAASGFEPV